MAQGKRSNKDKEMASMLKKQGVTRKVCRCAVCHNVVQLDAYGNHIRTCQGRHK